MIGESVMQWVRTHAHRLDRDLNNQLSALERPLRRVPRFLRKWVEKGLVYWKSYPVLVEFEETNYDKGMQHFHEKLRKLRRSRIRYEHPSISACSARLSVHGIRSLLEENPHVVRIHADRKVKALLDVATPTLHADVLQADRLTGQGVSIAILDTGIYPHPDLTHGHQRIIAFHDLVRGRTTPYDDNGHGTHCAGDAASNGYASHGKYRGPASEANLIGVKVLDANGSGSLSTIIAGIEWCMANRDQYGIRVLSMSLGSPGGSAANDPLVKAVEKAWASGIVVVVAAGNEGPDPYTISSPGISPRVLTVGAANDVNTTNRGDDQIASFSSRGPTLDGAMKPDLLCPGVNIISLRSPRSQLDRYHRSDRIGSYYFQLSGTSMATPLCAGVVAQLLQAEPGLSPDEVKQRMLGAAVDVGLPPNVQGKGYLDAARLLSNVGAAGSVAGGGENCNAESSGTADGRVDG